VDRKLLLNNKLGLTTHLFNDGEHVKKLFKFIALDFFYEIKYMHIASLIVQFP
jgi:hypothetical protein